MTKQVCLYVIRRKSYLSFMLAAVSYTHLQWHGDKCNSALLTQLCEYFIMRFFTLSRIKLMMFYLLPSEYLNRTSVCLKAGTTEKPGIT